MFHIEIFIAVFCCHWQEILAEMCSLSLDNFSYNYSLRHTRWLYMYVQHAYHIFHAPSWSARLWADLTYDLTPHRSHSPTTKKRKKSTTLSFQIHSSTMLVVSKNCSCSVFHRKSPTNVHVDLYFNQMDVLSVIYLLIRNNL